MQYKNYNVLSYIVTFFLIVFASSTYLHFKRENVWMYVLVILQNDSQVYAVDISFKTNELLRTNLFKYFSS